MRYRIYLIHLDVFMCVYSHQDCAIKNKKNKYEQINRKHNTHQQYKHTSNIKQYTYTSKKGKRSTRNHHNNSMRVYGCVFCSAPLLFVYLRMRISENASSIAGVLFDSVGSLRATLLLHTICMRS